MFTEGDQVMSSLAARRCHHSTSGAWMGGPGRRIPHASHPKGPAYYCGGVLIGKTSIDDAFRIIPIHPSYYHLFGITWETRFFYDRCLPMGCAEYLQD